MAMSMKMAVFWDVVPWSLALMMEAVSTSDMSVTIYQTTQHNIPEDSHIHPQSCSSLNMRDKVSHTYEITGKIIVLYILIFMILNSRWGNKRF
jgi:hypothetical protein